MLKFLSNRNKIYNGYVFNKQNKLNQYEINQQIILFLLEFFQKNKINLNYYSYDDEKFVNHKINTVFKMKNIKSIESVYFGYEDKDGQFLFYCSVTKSNPSYLLLFYREDFKIDFDCILFSKKLHYYFSYEYGYNYQVKNTEHFINYGVINYHKINYVIDDVRKKESDFRWWFKNRESFDDGILRDIFRFNWLNQKQLEINYNNYSLKEYIEQEKKGDLLKINEEIYLWILKDNELNSIRNEMYKKISFFPAVPKSSK